MAKARIPLTVSLNIDEFSGGEASRFSSFVHNGIIQDNDPEPERKTFVTQRPSINQFEDPLDEAVADRRGRGIYFFDENSTRYIVNNDTVYQGDYGTANATNISAGTGKVYIDELDTNLIIIDADNNEGWSMTSGNALASIADADFPPGATASLTLTDGVAVLNGYAFVGTTNGRIYNSDNGSVSAWTSTAFVTAERSADAGTFITKHHDHIVFFGSHTTEFFYDAANPSPASPLARRRDLFYSIGCVEAKTAWTAGDETLFCGTDGSGGIGVYKLSGFKIAKVSQYGMDAFLSEILTNASYSAVGTGFSALGRKFYVLTVHTTPSDINSTQSFVYDVTRNVWHTWGTGLAIVDTNGNFPVVDWTLYKGSAPRTGEGICANGTLINLKNTLLPVDSEGQNIYIVDGYIADGYFLDTEATSTNIDMIIRTGHQDLGTTNRKYPSELRVVGDFTDTDADNATIRWSDGNHNSYATYSRDINLGRQKNIKRNGSFDRRSWELRYAGAEIVRAEAIELFVREGRN